MNGENLSIPELICELTRKCNLKEEYFAASFNLSPTEVRLLNLFSANTSLSIRELKEKLKLTSGRVTHILTSLEDKNLVSRVPDVNDKRNILVNLRPKAHLLINNLKESYDDLHKRILQNLKPAERENITSSLQKLNDLLGKWENKK